MYEIPKVGQRVQVVDNPRLVNSSICSKVGKVISVHESRHGSGLFVKLKYEDGPDRVDLHSYMRIELLEEID